MSRVLVVGGGPAGMMAAAAAGNAGHTVRLYEKNEKLGKKLYLTGKGRCNVTNACSIEEFFQAVISNPKFLYSSFRQFDNQDIMECLEKNGCPLKTERGNRVFPVSDKSSDVIRALERILKKNQVEICLNEEVKTLLVQDGKCVGIRKKEENGIAEDWADAVIVSTGGLSYPSTGSTGDGLLWAKDFGHSVKSPVPALVPFLLQEEEAGSLQGLSLRNVEIRVFRGEKERYRDFGELVFTHFGVSGPVILSASSFAARDLKKGALGLSIDLKPALSMEQLDSRILKDFAEEKNKQFKNSLSRLLPAKIIPLIIKRSQISPEKKVNEVTRQERCRLADCIKDLRFTITGTRDFKEAIITQGGVSVKEVNPSTMESKKVSGLYFAGEVLDLDAVTGGFNLQIAWSSGWTAGSSVR